MTTTTSDNVRVIPRGGMKLPEACQYLGGISVISMRRLIKDGRIKPNRQLRHILIPVSELDRFLAK